MDRIGADFYYCLESIEKQLGARPVAVQLPIGTEADFKGVIDLVKMKAIIWNAEDLGASFDDVDIPEDLKDKVSLSSIISLSPSSPSRSIGINLFKPDTHPRLLSTARSLLRPPLRWTTTPWKRTSKVTRRESGRDEVKEKEKNNWEDRESRGEFRSEEPDEESLKKLIRKGTLNFDFVPVLLGTAFKNKGVQPLLDAVIDYLPAPIDVEAIKGETKDGEATERHSTDDEPFSALAFKIATDPYVGTLTFARIYSGVLKSGDQIVNSVKNKKERVSRMVRSV
eukprot:1390716-Amorphochlora_amoeboformis.AAC.1